MDRKLSSKIRNAILFQRKQAIKVRFRDGEILVYGKIPHTKQVGWYFVGYVLDVENNGLSGIGLSEGLP